MKLKMSALFITLCNVSSPKVLRHSKSGCAVRGDKFPDYSFLAAASFQSMAERP
jgi:hypothetical protein